MKNPSHWALKHELQNYAERSSLVSHYVLSSQVTSAHILYHECIGHGLGMLRTACICGQVSG